MKKKGLFLFIGVFLLSCGMGKYNKLVPNEDYAEKLSKISNNYKADLQSKVDVLFVVDDSGSMGSHQERISRQIYRFINVFKNVPLDYHIGVTTTSMGFGSGGSSSGYSGYSGGYNRPGTYRINASGRLITGEGGDISGDVKYIKRDTKDGLKKLSSYLKVGSSGSSIECLFLPVAKSMEDCETCDAVIREHNQGFYREGAYLVLIFITDTVDQCSYTARSLWEALTIRYKNPSKIFTFGALITDEDARNFSNDSSCRKDDSQPDQDEFPETFIDISGGERYSLCGSENFGDHLASFGKRIIETVLKDITLDSIPAPNTIQVSYGGKNLPNDYRKGWSYDPTKGAIRLGRDLLSEELEGGEDISIQYVPANLKKSLGEKEVKEEVEED